jgi:hypothetical protein
MRYVKITTLITQVAFVLSAQASEFSPHVGQNFPREVFWGDTHLHSNLSTDAFNLGVSLGPEDAYRFASGQEVVSTHGLPVRVGRPLDFVVLADHAESLGMMNLVLAGDDRIMHNPDIAEWHRILSRGSLEEKRELQRSSLTYEGITTTSTLFDNVSSAVLQKDIWQSALAIAERYNRPGVFTTLLGFEWSSAPGGSNLHRVVIFRDGADKVSQVVPLSSTLGTDPSQLWDYLQDYEQQTQGHVLAVPHNGNLSNGLMFPYAERLDGAKLDADYAKRRARWEPVVEVTQIKGDGEAHPLLSPDDEFADYETWDFGNFKGEPKSGEMLPHEYARSALKLGLQLERRHGINPYRFGMIGSTDSHTALATAAEDNFFGKHSGLEPGPNRWQRPMGRGGDTIISGWQQASSGYAAVWARDNTRASLWDAIKRREVYATTGSRLTVRFFGGWEFSAEDALAPDIAATGYAKGVPMGGELPGSQGKHAPSFLISASKDNIGANLDRIQLVKGWIDNAGDTHEKVYDVSWAGERAPGPDGALPPVGNTVNLETATWINSVGEPQLSTVWTDPSFDARQSAFYYVRVIEIPTPRWTAYDAKRYGASLAEEVPVLTQERAYTSPIWYRPNTDSP